jgi:hypothetical protein
LRQCQGLRRIPAHTGRDQPHGEISRTGLASSANSEAGQMFRKPGQAVSVAVVQEQSSYLGADSARAIL